MSRSHLRHLADALGPHSDYSYDKRWKRGLAGRRSQAQTRKRVTRAQRAADKRRTERLIADET